MEYIKDFFTKTQSKYYFDEILGSIELQQNQVKVFGKIYDEPRLTAIFGDDTTKSYTYSKSKRQLKKFPDILENIRNILFEKTGIYYDFVLVNYYRDGNDKIGWHSDNEPEMDHSSIASISFGESRTFKIKEIKTGIVKKIVLEDGSLFIMKNNFQDIYQHCIPKEANKKARINLTFRKFIK